MARKALLPAAAGLVLAGCCGDDVHVVTLAFNPQVGLETSYAWVGDTITLYAAASSDPTSMFCFRELYNSNEAPQRFYFRSTDSAVATLSDRALFTAHAAGVSRLITASGGITDTTWAIVSPPFAAFRITVTPLTAGVGDTVTVQVDALDGSGAAVDGALARPAQLEPPSNKLATWVPNPRPSTIYPNDEFPTPLVDRLVVRGSGVITILAAASHDSGRPLRFVADSVTLIVAP